MSDVQTQLPRRVHQPELTTVDGKVRSTKIGWNHRVAIQYLLANSQRFVEIEEFCRIFWGKVVEDNRRRVRKNLAPLFKYALHNHSVVLVVEQRNRRGLIGAVKILDKTSKLEQSIVSQKIRKMRQRKEINETEYQLVLQLAAPDEPAEI